jgi:hypothetical protein
VLPLFLICLELTNVRDEEGARAANGFTVFNTFVAELYSDII